MFVGLKERGGGGGCSPLPPPQGLLTQQFQYESTRTPSPDEGKAVDPSLDGSKDGQDAQKVHDPLEAQGVRQPHLRRGGIQWKQGQRRASLFFQNRTVNTKVILLPLYANALLEQP